MNTPRNEPHERFHRAAALGAILVNVLIFASLETLAGHYGALLALGSSLT